MSDREAFVSAIAANPADDLPRLVFADWLDEHGDPERAEFIRTQIRWHHADAEERKQLNAHAADLFREHWQRWFGPFILSLDPHADPARQYQVLDSSAAFMVNVQSKAYGLDEPPVSRVTVHRGLVGVVNLDVARWSAGASVGQAFRYEPPSALICDDALHSPVWARFTDPALRRVNRLTLLQQWAWDVSAPESTALLEDPHLAGVRSFHLSTQPTAAGRRLALPVAWLERFVRSSLAYRLSELSLGDLTPDGIGPLGRPGRLHLERLELGGELNVESVRRLGESELGGSVRVLVLDSASLGDAAVAALARHPWRKLTRLGLNRNTFTAAVLPALAAGAFVPQLKQFDLSGNPLFSGDERDMARLQELADALDPERLERLDLTDTGLSVVPDFLTERFGDRVRI